MQIEWVHSKYGESQRAVLAQGLRLEIVKPVGSKSEPPRKWKATIFGATLKAEFETAQDAKEAAERIGRKWLTEALAKL